MIAHKQTGWKLKRPRTTWAWRAKGRRVKPHCRKWVFAVAGRLFCLPIGATLPSLPLLPHILSLTAFAQNIVKSASSDDIDPILGKSLVVRRPSSTPIILMHVISLLFSNYWVWHLYTTPRHADQIGRKSVICGSSEQTKSPPPRRPRGENDLPRKKCPDQTLFCPCIQVSK